MNQPSENIGGRIGALELSDAVSAMNDGALESAAGSIYAGATVDAMGCPGGVAMTKSVIHCRRIDDGALEEAGGAVYAGSTNQPSICRR